MYNQRFYVNVTTFHPEVTGSCFLCEVKIPGKKDVKFVIDAGMFQEKPYEVLNNVLDFDPTEIDFALITHNHCDHTGKLKLMCKYGFNKPIYCTRTTRELMLLSIEDDYKISLSNSSSINVPNCVREDFEAVKRNLIPTDLFDTFEPCSNVRVTFLDNGHLLGAACIFIQIFDGDPDCDETSINLLATGDYSPESSFVRVQEVPDWIKKKQVHILQEATYGSTHSSSIKKTFANNIKENIQNKKTVVALAFSQERFEEILLELWFLREQGWKFKIYLDGPLAEKYFSIYKRKSFGFKEHARDFLKGNYLWVKAQEREHLINSKEPKVLVTTAGMGDHGPAQFYLPEMLRKDYVNISFNGYVAEGSIGRKIIEGKDNKTVNIFGQEILINASVFTTNEFSSHAKSDELLSFLQPFTIKSLLINHGCHEAKKGYYDLVLKQRTNIKTIAICNRGVTHKLNPWGIVKSFQNLQTTTQTDQASA